MDENLGQFLKERYHDYIICEPTIAPLTKPGENYLSVILQVDVKLNKDENSEEEITHVVAKCVKTSNDFVKELFPIAFMNEINFYREVIPALQNFQRERGIEDLIIFFPEFFGAKMNKNGHCNNTDEDAIILLENLKYKGYQNINRFLGFDLDGAKLILKDLATLHATAMGLKFTNRDEFENKIKKYCTKAIPPPPPKDKNPYKESLKIFFEILEDYKECQKYLVNLKQKFSMMREKINDFYETTPREPFATLVHCDVWVNNTMQLCENGKLTKNKFVDFQLYFYQSPAADVLFFLWSSVQLEILTTDFQNLLHYYYYEFNEYLRKLNCNTNLFTYEKFLEEVDFCAPTNFMDIMYMTMFIAFGKKATDDGESQAIDNIRKKDIPKVAKDKIAYMVKEYGRRGWI